MGQLRPLTLHFRQLTVNVEYKFLPMAGFEPQAFVVRSNCSSNWVTPLPPKPRPLPPKPQPLPPKATTTAPKVVCFESCKAKLFWFVSGASSPIRWCGSRPGLRSSSLLALASAASLHTRLTTRLTTTAWGMPSSSPSQTASPPCSLSSSSSRSWVRNHQTLWYSTLYLTCGWEWQMGAQ